VEGDEQRQVAIIADGNGEVNREKPTITCLFPQSAKSILNRQLIREIQEK
jgi:nitric oxide synthase oxygenase domain/subunit